MTSNKVKKQHYVPQFYLRNFSKNGKRIEVFDKEQRKSYPANIKDVACGNYFHDIDNEHFKDETQEMEKFLSRLEGNYKNSLDSVLKKLKDAKIEYLNTKSLSYDFNITQEEKRGIAEFFVLQWIRTDKKRKEFTQITETLRQAIKEHCEDANIDFNQVDTKYDVKMSQLDMIFSSIEPLSSYLMEQKWLFGMNMSAIPFYTSDNPAILDKEFCENKKYRGNGFESPNINFYLPLNSKFILLVVEKNFYELGKYIDLYINNIACFDNDNVLYCNDLQLKESLFQIYSETSEFFHIEQEYCHQKNINGKKDRLLIRSNYPTPK